MKSNAEDSGEQKTTVPPISGTLPPFNYHGFLPEGVHLTTLEELKERFATNPSRIVLFQKLSRFLEWAISTGQFSQAFVNGGFITNKAAPEDVDVILQTRADYGTAAFTAMEPSSLRASTRFSRFIPFISTSGARVFREA